jgi:transposase
MTSAFCLATDATGVSIQPTRLNDENGGRKRQACRKGHFFVTLADHDHVSFRLSRSIRARQYANCLRNTRDTFRPTPMRFMMRFFAAPMARVLQKALRDLPRKSVAGRMRDANSTQRLSRRKIPMRCKRFCAFACFFQKEDEWRGLAPQQRTALRKSVLGPWLLDFFNWAKACYEIVKDARGLLATAFGYAMPCFWMARTELHRPENTP